MAAGVPGRLRLRGARRCPTLCALAVLRDAVDAACVRMDLAGVCKASDPLSQTLPLGLTQPAHRTCRVYSCNEVRSLPSSLTPFVNTVLRHGYMG